MGPETGSVKKGSETPDVPYETLLFMIGVCKTLYLLALQFLCKSTCPVGVILAGHVKESLWDNVDQVTRVRISICA